MSKTNQDPFIVSSLCIEALLNLGVQDFVLCAGSRNAPIIETLTKAADGTNKETNEEVKRDIALYSHFEERSASHFALGVAVRKKKAVCIVCTSGTAVAEILPACIEAYYRGIILIVLSADRPSRYRGSGAPQCIEQENVFGLYCERLEFDDLCKISQDSGEKTRFSKSQHINLSLEEWPIVESATKDPESRNFATKDPVDLLKTAERPVAVVGSLENYSQLEKTKLRQFLEDSQIPILSDASGNVFSQRTHGQWIWHEKQLDQMTPDLVIRFGGVPSFRFWRNLDESLQSLPVINVQPFLFEGLSKESHSLSIDELSFADLEKLRNCYFRAFENVQKSWNKLLRFYPSSEMSLLAGALKKFKSGDSVFWGNSLAVRLAALLAPHLDGDLEHLDQRGANGIDGLLSSFLGRSEESGRHALVIGDLSFLYDSSALYLWSQCSSSPKYVFILNNGGGKIFSRIPRHLELRKRTQSFLETPQDVSLSAISEAWKVPFVKIERAEIFESINLFSEFPHGAIVELACREEESLAFSARWKEMLL